MVCGGIYEMPKTFDKGAVSLSSSTTTSVHVGNVALVTHGTHSGVTFPLPLADIAYQAR